LLQWTAGWAGVAAWTQSWNVVRRGHFRITSWIVLGLAICTYFALGTAVPSGSSVRPLAGLGVALAAVYLAAQYVKPEAAGTLSGAALTLAGLITLVVVAGLLAAWPGALAALHLVAGAVFLGAVTNGMMLGHWYLNQPGLKPWALARLTRLALGAVAAAGLLGLVSAVKLSNASTEGAVLGLPGFGASFGAAFYGIWLVLLLFTGGVVWMARRCIKIRSIQSATGLYYVAILTAGVAEFLIRYLMVNAT
jgi:hypothetical protein